jgi:hypothetical protein
LAQALMLKFRLLCGSDASGLIPRKKIEMNSLSLCRLTPKERMLLEMRIFVSLAHQSLIRAFLGCRIAEGFSIAATVLPPLRKLSDCLAIFRS